MSIVKFLKSHHPIGPGEMIFVKCSPQENQSLLAMMSPGPFPLSLAEGKSMHKGRFFRLISTEYVLSCLGLYHGPVQ